MNICDINPFVRFAGKFEYISEGVKVRVKDCRLFYIVNGGGEVIVENQHYTLDSDSLFFCPEGGVYTLRTPNGATVISLNFDLTQDKNNCVELNPPIPCDEESRRIGICQTNDDIFSGPIFENRCGELLYDFNHILDEFSSCRAYYREMSSGILKRILVSISRHRTFSTNKGMSSLDTVIRYISENYYKKITNKELADLVGYHEYHLNRLFVRHTGQSLHKYIINKRLNEAKMLMRSSEISLNEVAERVGFNDYSFFSSYFKKQFGISPFRYKETAKQLIP